jgi:hypothetical protein
MLIESLRGGLLIEECCKCHSSGMIEVPNSENEKDLRKVWIDCSEADDALLISLETKKNSQLSPLFRKPGNHLKACDGVIVVSKGGEHHVLFCELKTSWDAKAIRQVRNSHLFFKYAHSLALEWHGATVTEVKPWFAILTTGHLPTVKYKTRISSDAIPASHRPSQIPTKPQKLRLIDGKGQSPNKPLPLSHLIRFS